MRLKDKIIFLLIEKFFEWVVLMDFLVIFIRVIFSIFRCLCTICRFGWVVFLFMCMIVLMSGLL